MPSSGQASQVEYFSAILFRQRAASIYGFVRFVSFRLFRFVKKNVCLNNHAHYCLIHFYSKLIWKTTYDGRRLMMEDDL